MKSLVTLGQLSEQETHIRTSDHCLGHYAQETRLQRLDDITLKIFVLLAVWAAYNIGPLSSLPGNFHVQNVICVGKYEA